MSTTATRPNAAKIKVICLGLSRTGTMSLRDALIQLGFGPCYHGTTIQFSGGADLATWAKIGDGNGTAEDLDNILRGYGSALDVPVALYSEELYAAYPDAKYILTIRDPEKWEKSMKATVLQSYQYMLEMPEKSKSVLIKRWSPWAEEYQDKRYHHGRLRTHLQEEFLAHTERVKKNIPSDKLLVYEIGEGWDRLVEFLSVPKPDTPFPHINDTVEYQEKYLKRLEKVVKHAESAQRDG